MDSNLTWIWRADITSEDLTALGRVLQQQAANGIELQVEPSGDRDRQHRVQVRVVDRSPGDAMGLLRSFDEMARAHRIENI